MERKVRIPPAKRAADLLTETVNSLDATPDAEKTLVSAIRALKKADRLVRQALEERNRIIATRVAPADGDDPDAQDQSLSPASSRAAYAPSTKGR